MDEKKKKWLNILSMALTIALMPPIWAVLSPYLGITTGGVALICAGLYVANGNKKSDSLKICIGFLLGDAWAVAAIFIMGLLTWNPNIELYCTLFLLGGLAVIIGETFSNVIFLPSWLCGWAIGLTIMGQLSMKEIGTLPIEIGAAMIAGVIYVGVGADLFQHWLINKVTRGKA